MIAVVEYGIGNLGSILNMLRKIGVEVTVTRDPAVLASAEKILLPGVGAFDRAVEHLQRFGLKQTLDRLVHQDKKKILGICLGMQLLGDSSEEGQLEGLGWIPGRTKRFRFGADSTELKVPHMGWNQVEASEGNELFRGIELSNRFYFVHSYHFVPRSPECAIGLSLYGHPFVSAVQRENIFGVQFHPEKSHAFGMQLLRNFVQVC